MCTTDAPQMAMTAASSARRVPGLAPMAAWATIAEGSSLFAMFPIMKAWYIAAGPSTG